MQSNAQLVDKPAPPPPTKKTIRLLHVYADGLCEWEFTWFPSDRRILPTDSMGAMIEYAELMGYELEGLPSEERNIVQLESHRGCPTEVL